MRLEMQNDSFIQQLRNHPLHHPRWHSQNRYRFSRRNHPADPEKNGRTLFLENISRSYSKLGRPFGINTVANSNNSIQIIIFNRFSLSFTFNCTMLSGMLLIQKKMAELFDVKNAQPS
jgi:hypothetical protein